MILKHKFAKEKEVLQLFSGTVRFSEFKSKLKKLSKTLPKTLPFKYGRLDPKDNEYKILGDGFEVFCELLVNIMGTHPHIGLSNYDPVDIDEDQGVDAYAVNIKNERSAVQCKFVSDPSYEFTANGSNLCNFLIEANFKGIDFKSQRVKRLFLITTAKGLHYRTIEKWQDSLWVIGGDTINFMIDDNIIFWNKCEEILKDHISRNTIGG